MSKVSEVPEVPMIFSGKKSMVLVVLLLLLGIPFKGMAAERQIQGGLVQRESRIYFETGFEALSRDVTQEETQFAGLIFPGQTTSVQSLRLLAKLGVRVADPLEIYAIEGGSDLQIDEFGFNSSMLGIYGGGARVILFREHDPRAPYQIFLDYRFLRSNTHDTVLFKPKDDNGDILTGGGQGELLRETIRWTEHTIKFGVQGRHFEYEPYGGVRFSFVNATDHLPSQMQHLNVDLKQRDTFGLFVGTRYYLSPSEQAALFIEGSIIDQFSLAGGIRVSY
ncbi:MAG: hypothetical protein WAO55_00275 [Candidatus Manganitrophaceae bacterium]